jgi:hypothetical protein
MVDMDREALMSLDAEVEAAIDVLKRFALQAHDWEASVSRPNPAAEEVARVDIQLADIEALLTGICRARAELQVQTACRAFISPWI